jgi:hypothetical protein
LHDITLNLVIVANIPLTIFKNVETTQLLKAPITMSQFTSFVLLIATFYTSMAFNVETTSQNTPRNVAMSSTYAQTLYPSEGSLFPQQGGASLNPYQTLQRNVVGPLLNSLASLAASTILHATDAMSQSTTHEKLHNLPNDVLAQMILQDAKERNSLVTADFSQSIYDDDTIFKDGSGLDGAYPMAPWILGCKMLFNEQNSLSTIVEETLVATLSHITFRFEGDLEFRGPFSPQVFLTGQVIMTRDPVTGLINSYKELWDKDVFQICKEARLHY